jgi:hypothetical protein
MRAALVTAVAGALVAACASYGNIERRYYEPQGPGKLVASSISGGPGDTMQFAAAGLSLLSVSATLGTDSTSICIVALPSGNATVRVASSLVVEARAQDGAAMARQQDQYWRVFTTPSLSPLDPYPIGVLPTEVRAEALQGKGFPPPELRAGFRQCSRFASSPAAFVATLGTLSVDGTAIALPPVRFEAKRGTYTYHIAPS